MRSQIAAALCAVFLYSTHANAETRLESPRGFYLAVDYNLDNASGSSFGGADIALGYRFNRRFGFEGGVQASRVYGATITNSYVEAQYLVGLWRNTSLMLSLGGSIATVSAYYGPYFAGISEAGFRAGAGFEFRLSDRWTYRTTVHYQNALDNVGIFAAGISYRL